MTTITSTYGMENQSITSLNQVNTTLNTLTTELTTGKVYSDLAQYSTGDQSQIYDLSSEVDQLQGYQQVNDLVKPTIDVYDTTLTDISSIVSEVQQLIESNQSGTADASSTAAELKGYMQQIQDDLNQEVNGTYIYNGNRSSTTAPVGDITALVVPPTETGATTSPLLPTYDSEANGSTTVSDANAYATQSAQIDTSYTMGYGISSDNPAFQNVILAVRYAYAATQTSDTATYQSYMQQASSLLSLGQTGVEQLQAQNAANSSTLSSVSSNQTSLVAELQTQLNGIENANTTSVATQISFLQTQLEASYDATSIVAKASLAQYLI